jgi:hypothetical protein
MLKIASLALRVKGHIEAPLVEVPHRASEVGAAAVARIAVRLRLAHGLLHRLHDQRRRRPVRISDPKADHVDSSRALGGDLALELRERVRRDALQAFTCSHELRHPRPLAGTLADRAALMLLAAAR